MRSFLNLLFSSNILILNDYTYIIFKDLVEIGFNCSPLYTAFEFDKFFIGSLFIIFTDFELRHILMNYCLLTHHRDSTYSVHSIEYIFKRLKERIFNNYSTIILDNKYW